MKYSTLTQDHQDDVVAQGIISREKEHYSYALAKSNFEAILRNPDVAQLPEEWPDNIKQFKVLHGEALAAVLKGDQYTLAIQLQFRDRTRLLLATTICEMTKTEHHHAALSAKLPEGEKRNAAIARVQAKK